jgi:hypothetical protein
MERSAGERRSTQAWLELSEDPDVLDADSVPDDGLGVAMPAGPMPAPRWPWYEAAPGGEGTNGAPTPPGGPRFLQGVPDANFLISTGDHATLAARSHLERYHAGIFNGNTGFRSNGPYETGDLSETAKTGITGAFLLGAVGLVYFLYASPGGIRLRG